MNTFDPNLPGVPNGRYFALPFSREEAEIVLISVPWDVTTSYRDGTRMGPEAIIDASAQIDLFNTRVDEAWNIPIATLEEHEELPILNRTARNLAQKIIQSWEDGIDPRENGLGEVMDEVNSACARMNRIVYLQCSEQLRAGKLVGLVGGEHSVPFGHLQALGEHYGSFGILHIDAHADLREAYEGFTFSHASIMYNALKSIPAVTALTQVGVRDYCREEHLIIRSDPRIAFFPDESLNEDLYEGLTWREQCHRIMESLPEQVYISLDIDGLSPDLCPHTGTPVPGGLSFQQVDYLLYLLASSPVKIIGFDVCEVAPGENDPWDAIVGARILHKICCYSYLNNKK
ncbi:MAG: agmatinase family protein [Candidatus Methanomethylophilaceae archaeon]|jgi:agmatinase